MTAAAAEASDVKPPRVDPFNLANLLTGFRIAAVPVILFLMVADWGPPGLAGDYGKIAALLLSMAAGITDYVDGVVARAHSLETRLGKFLDPVADKLLVCSLFVLFTADGVVAPWVLIVMLWREFLVLGLRMYLASEGTVMGASHWAKFKTIFQIAAVVSILMVRSLVVVAVSGLIRIPWATMEYYNQITGSIVNVSIVLSIVSGAEYYLVHWRVFTRG
jgi:CDP-diacylglycerol--glycerol-3-phosphate 3-phosphatidyltransferase